MPLDIAKYIKSLHDQPFSTIPANHIRTPDGKDVKVLGEIPLTADGCLVGMHAKLHYFEEPYEQSHYPTDDSAFFDDIAFMNDEVVGGSVPFAKCFSTREAALTPTPTP